MRAVSRDKAVTSSAVKKILSGIMDRAEEKILLETVSVVKHDQDDTMTAETDKGLVLCRFLKIRNRECRFLLPFSERRNCESKNDSFLIHFTILLANNSGIYSRKKAKNSQGIGIAILLESESTQP